MKRFSIDLKGPLPSSSKLKYFLTVIDEYSRFPFAFPCPNISTETVIKCLEVIFSVFGMPEFIHSDRGFSFMSAKLAGYFRNRGIASSHSTPYHPTGNSQVERFNGIVWKAVRLALASAKLPVEQWESVLLDAFDHCFQLPQMQPRMIDFSTFQENLVKGHHYPLGCHRAQFS